MGVGERKKRTLRSSFLLLQNLFALLNPRGKLVTPYGDKLICATKDLNGKVLLSLVLCSALPF